MEAASISSGSMQSQQCPECHWQPQQAAPERVTGVGEGRGPAALLLVNNPKGKDERIRAKPGNARISTRGYRVDASVPPQGCYRVVSGDRIQKVSF